MDEKRGTPEAKISCGARDAARFMPPIGKPGGESRLGLFLEGFFGLVARDDISQ